MKLHFDPNQEYQLQAIKSIVDIFEGQPLSRSDFEFSITEGSLRLTENGVGNNLVLSEEQLLDNLQQVQKRNELDPVSEKLEGLNFTVEMETGTGKTYVYLRTVYELNKVYGFNKKNNSCNAEGCSLQEEVSVRISEIWEAAQKLIDDLKA